MTAPPVKESTGFGGGGGFGLNVNVNTPFGAEVNQRRTMSVDEIPPFQAGVNTGFGGRPAPVQPPHPEI